MSLMVLCVINKTFGLSKTHWDTNFNTLFLINLKEKIILLTLSLLWRIHAGPLQVMG